MPKERSLVTPEKRLISDEITPMTDMTRLTMNKAEMNFCKPSGTSQELKAIIMMKNNTNPTDVEHNQTTTNGSRPFFSRLTTTSSAKASS